jgi:hypothetical protein
MISRKYRLEVTRQSKSHNHSLTLTFPDATADRSIGPIHENISSNVLSPTAVRQMMTWGTECWQENQNQFECVSISMQNKQIAV